jgi:hypothetical protein
MTRVMGDILASIALIVYAAAADERRVRPSDLKGPVFS